MEQSFCLSGHPWDLSSWSSSLLVVRCEFKRSTCFHLSICHCMLINLSSRSPLYDYISKFLANTNFVCNAVLFMILDRRFSRRVRSLLFSFLHINFPCFKSKSAANRTADVDDLTLGDDEEMGMVVTAGNGSAGRSVTNTSVGSGVIAGVGKGYGSPARPGTPTRHLDIESIRHGGNSPNKGRA